MMKRERIVLLDELRGLALLNMIAYHVCYDLYALFPTDNMAWFRKTPADIWQICICSLFLLLAGICVNFSKSPWIRTAKVAGGAVILTAVTALIMPNQIILFGILHCMACCMFFAAILRKPLEKASFWLWIPSFLLFLLTYNVPRRMLGIATFSAKLPSALYQSPWGFPFGFPDAHFFSSDYFPLIPYLFLFFTGCFLGKYVHKLPDWLKRSHIPPLAFLGRHSLLIYLLHQPVIYFILNIIY